MQEKKEGWLGQICQKIGQTLYLRGKMVLCFVKFKIMEDKAFFNHGGFYCRLGTP